MKVFWFFFSKKNALPFHLVHDMISPPSTLIVCPVM
jgi:hypothetical protein